jgi:hypothetical protein
VSPFVKSGREPTGGVLEEVANDGHMLWFGRGPYRACDPIVLPHKGGKQESVSLALEEKLAGHTDQ